MLQRRKQVQKELRRNRTGEEGLAGHSGGDVAGLAHAQPPGARAGDRHPDTGAVRAADPDTRARERSVACARSTDGTSAERLGTPNCRHAARDSFGQLAPPLAACVDAILAVQNAGSGGGAPRGAQEATQNAENTHPSNDNCERGGDFPSPNEPNIFF